MREILFRGKRLKDKKWIEGSLLVLDADSGYYFITEPYESASTLPVRDLIYNHTHLVEPETVCQFTGLTDKNGVKIFEGDVVKLYHFNEAYGEGVVRWDRDLMGFYYDYYKCMSPVETYEVIGNIFDNPELMEGGAK